LKVRILEAQNLPAAKGLFGAEEEVNAYMRCEYGGKALFTSVVTMDAEKRICVFNQEFWLPVMMPVMSDRLVISIYEHEKILKDVLLGSMVFSVKKLLSQGSNSNGLFFWKSLFGAPLSVDDKDAAYEMNSNPEVASL
jgi:Ca2+-dependent lipid-binding protein